MEGYELLVYLQKKRDELARALTESKKRGIALADAERDYKREKAKFIAQARMDKIQLH